MHFRVDLHGRPEPCFEIARFRAMARVNGDQHSCAAFWVKGVAETLKAAELDVAALLDEARRITPSVEKWRRQAPPRYAALPLHAVTNFRL